MTRVFVLMLFYCQMGSGAEQTSAFPRFKLSSFDAAEKVEREQEIAFVKSHVSALAKAILPIFQQAAPDATVTRRFLDTSTDWDGNPLPGDRSGRPVFTAAIFERPPLEGNGSTAVSIERDGLVPLECVNGQVRASVDVCTDLAAECRVLLFPDKPKGSLAAFLQMGIERAPCGYMHAASIEWLENDSSYDVTFMCRLLSKASSGDDEMVWQPPPSSDFATRTFRVVNCALVEDMAGRTRKRRDPAPAVPAERPDAG